MRKIKRFVIRISCRIFLLVCLSGVTFGQKENPHLLPPEIIRNPSKTQDHSAETRRFTGIPSLAVSAKGRMWAVWYAGPTPGEDKNNYVVVSTSSNGGKTWKEVIVIDPDGPGPVRAFDPEVWMDPEGWLWVFWAQESGPRDKAQAGVWYMKTGKPDRNNPGWSKPERITDGVMMCKPTVLSGGDWALPVNIWRRSDDSGEPVKGSARMVVSSDKGTTWELRGAVDVPGDVRNFDEHMIVERKDGSLWMLVRTNYGIGESISTDKGKTWSSLTPSQIKHPSARFFIRRLQSGNLLLVKHGPVNERTGRSHLTAFISRDDGHSWSEGLLLDERTGVSYPDGQQTKDGMIHIIYDYNRTKDQLILMTGFTEEDVLSNSDSARDGVVRKRRVVSKGGNLEP